jgi:hypothetical protein
MNSEFSGIRKETIVALLEVPTRCLPGRTEENKTTNTESQHIFSGKNRTDCEQIPDTNTRVAAQQASSNLYNEQKLPPITEAVGRF